MSSRPPILFTPSSTSPAATATTTPSPPSTPSPCFAFSTDLFNPTPKPSPMPLRKTIKLMDLPDEVLSQIIGTLSEPDGLRRHSVVFGPPAFPLALTCNRLLRLFSAQALHSIDALFPETYSAVPTRAIDGQVNERMLASMIRLAGTNLRSFHFPRDITGINLALNEIASNRIRLHELSYCESIVPVDEDTERAVFEHMGDLRRLNIFNPRAVLNYLYQAPNLQDLELTGVRPNALSSLVGALRKVGPTLRNLCVGFHTESMLSLTSAGASGVMTPIWCVASFATYISSRLAEDLPKLQTLDVSGARCSTIEHDSRVDKYNMAITPIVLELATRIDSMREKNALSSATKKLNYLTIRATFGEANPTAFKCLHSFRSIITPNVDVEIQAVGATVVFPADNSLPYFKALQISLRDLEMLPGHPDIDCTEIKTIDVGTNILSNAYAAHESIREHVMNLVWESTEELSELNIEIEVDSVTTMRNVCDYIADTLEISPNVDTLAFRTGVVDFADEGGPCFKRLLGFMQNIRILRLTTHPVHSADCKLAFGKNLPLFLNSVAKACPNLECLFLELAMPVQAASIAAADVREAAMQSYYECMRAVRDLEAAIPLCDATSVRSQLTVWYRYLNPVNWSALFC